MIFTTVGTQKFPFDRLIQSLDGFVESGRITEHVMAQIGNSNYIPRNFPYRRFLSAAEYDEYMRRIAA